MKAVILAGGKGKRMKELTKHIPKPMIKINQRPFLSYLIENLLELGFDIGIVVGYKKEKIIEFLNNNKIKAEIIEQKEQKGTGDAVKQVKAFVNGENFIVVMGDNYYEKQDLKNIAKQDEFCYVGCFSSQHPESYGVIIEKNGFLKDIVEKPKEFISNLVNTGLYKFTKDVFSALNKIKISERGEYELTDAIKILARENKVKIVKLSSWIDMSVKEDLARVEEFLNKK